MMRTRLRPAPLALAVSLAAALLPAAGTAAIRQPKATVEPTPDQALVYLIRTARFTGAAGTMFVYADDVFLGTLDNDSYAIARVTPGRRLFWTTLTRATREIDLVAGQVYYLDLWMSIGVLDEARGRRLVQEVRDLVTPTAKEQAKSAKHIENRYARAVRREGDKTKVAVEEVKPPSVPEDMAGLVRVPSGSSVRFVFLESAVSSISQPGDAVWLRVAEDLVVDGSAVVRRGVLVKGVVSQAGAAEAAGVGGTLDIAVPAVPATDGTPIPVTAQIAGSGGDRQGASATAGAFFGFIGALSVRGRQAFVLAGDEMRAFTRHDVWIRPAPPEAAAGGGPEAGGEAAPDPAPEPAASVKAAPPTDRTIKFVPKKGRCPDEIEIVVETEARPVEVEVRSIDGTDLPVPIAATETRSDRGGWTCVFPGWSLLRFVRPDTTADGVTLVLAGRLQDGHLFTAEAVLNVALEP